MTTSYDHGRELLYKGVLGLASGQEGVKKRLENAFVYELSGIREDELPPELWKKFAPLLKEVTATPTVGKEGTIAASINKMTTKRAVEIADEVFSIFVQLLVVKG